MVGAAALATTLLYSSAAAIPLTIGASGYSHSEVKVPDMIAGPNARSGLTAPPVMPPPISTAATNANPMDGAANAAGTLESVATAMITNTSRKVISASTMNGRMSLTPAAGTVAPRCARLRAALPTSPRSRRHR